ncbi:MAG: HAMP domain-containing protein [Polyangiaceae bacterium]|nr:HAMP domain-containing protein [Polyangiaceae bacterium]
MSKALLRALGRIRVRLLVVNLVALLVPVAGLEFARIHERQLLDALERDMRNQAALVAALVERDIDELYELGDPRHAAILTAAARRTRTRVRLLDAAGEVVADSHENGPPEGPEPPPPSIVPRSLRDEIEPDDPGPTPRTWPEVPDRPEVRDALSGRPAAATRVRARQPDVLLFIAEPIRRRGAVAGAVYAVRSTQPVLFELYRIRSGLLRVLAVALLGTGAVTLLLAWSISRPLGRLSRAARRVAAGEPDVEIPISGGGEIRELAESFASMKEQLHARLRYISDFAADVAHEFTSPLTSIRGAAELLDEGAADDPEARGRFLKNIELDVTRLDRLVSRLLELSRIEASSEAMSVLDLEALLARVARRTSTPERPVRLHYERPERFVRAREMDLETAVLNLVDNALRFSPPGEAVEIRVTDGAEGAPRGARPGAPDAGQRLEAEPSIAIAVSDRGPGIPEALLPRIFDRFFTTDEARNGTGLGLAIVQSVAQAHGGKVSVSTAAGAGTTFTIRLPRRG